MQVFITGGSGFVGRAIVRRLVDDGHAVRGLARSADGAERLRDLGAEPWRGELADGRGPVGADVAIHAAVDYTDPEFGELDRRAVAALLGSGARTLYLSSTLMYGDTAGDAVTEDREPAPLVQPYKLAGERAVLAAGGTVLRPGLVHGYAGSAHFDPLHAAAREGTLQYVGDGENRWSVVHADDLAALVALVIARPEVSLLHAGVDAPTMREVAEAVAALYGATAAPVSVADATGSMGAFADQHTRDLVVDSARARALGWTPVGPGLLESLGSLAPA